MVVVRLVLTPLLLLLLRLAATEGRMVERRKPRRQRLEKTAIDEKYPGRHEEEPMPLLLLVMPLLSLILSIRMIG